MNGILKILALAKEFEITETDYGYEICFKENYSDDHDIIARIYNRTKNVHYLMDGLANNFCDLEAINIERLDKLRTFCEYILKEENKK